MTLVETFEQVRPSIVALGSLMVPTKGSAPPAFPRIEGTGFIVDSRGIVVTNRHVAGRLEDLPSHPETGASVAFAMLPTPVFALGEDALATYGKVNQITPLLRHGIVSSLFPYPCPFPHGFTVDILTQGGESGSPVFLPDSPRVVGLLYEGFDEAKITTVIPSHIVSQALGSCLEATKFDFLGSPTYEELVNKEKKKQGLTWERLQSKDEGNE